MSKLNVGIADDNELMVHLLSDIVARDEELQVVGTACNGRSPETGVPGSQPPTYPVHALPDPSTKLE